MSFECRGVSKVYPALSGPIVSIDNVTFRAEAREFLCIVGPSGCGKTTLLKLIAGLLEPSSGEIIFDTSPDGGRPRNALVFQEHGLFPWMTVLDNVAFALEMQGVGRNERRRQALEFLQQMGLGPFARNYPHELSVGMRQRANIARAFIVDPDILLMDEPLGSLDAQTRLVLQEEVLRMWKQNQKLVVYVTHDIQEAVLLADRVLVMSGHPGRIREEIPVPLGRPRNLSDLDQPEVTQLVRRIWSILEDEVRRILWIKS